MTTFKNQLAQSNISLTQLKKSTIVWHFFDTWTKIMHSSLYHLVSKIKPSSVTCKYETWKTSKTLIAEHASIQYI